MAVTASTGCAACGVQGQTIHAWAGVGTGLGSDLSAEELFQKVGKHNKKNFREARVLLIDEISMISAKELDKLSELAGLVRHNSTSLPFGGLQLVLCGDFLQLPPVSKQHSPASFCFEAQVWKQLFPPHLRHQNTIILEKIQRQKEPVFQRILNSLRFGIVTPEVDWFLRRKAFNSSTTPVRSSCTDPDTTSSSPWFTNTTGGNRHQHSVKLYSRVEDVTRVNMSSLAALPSTHTVTFLAQDSLHVDSTSALGTSATKSLYNRLNAETRAVHTLELKVGAQVMLIANLDTGLGLVNGARGRVVRFEVSQDDVTGEEVLLPVVRFSINSSNLSHAEMKEEKQRRVAAMQNRLPVSNRGYQLFTALGYQAWDGLGAEQQGDVDPIACPLSSQCSMGLASQNIQATVERTIDFYQFYLKNSVEKIVATRRQVPLMLAYAITIHKVT